MNQKYTAQAIVEYALIGALVVAVTLPVIKPLGHNTGVGIKNAAPINNKTPMMVVQSNAKVGSARTASGTVVATSGSYNDPIVNPNVSNPSSPGGPTTPVVPPASSIKGCAGEDLAQYQKDLNDLINKCETYPPDPYVSPDVVKYVKDQGFVGSLGWCMSGTQAPDWLAEHSTLHSAIKNNLNEYRLLVMSALTQDGGLNEDPCWAINGYMHNLSRIFNEQGVTEGSKQKFCHASYNDLKDPYKVTINGSQYVFVQDKNSDGKFNNAGELLGYSDTKDSLFNEMISLDTNKDGIITSQELAGGKVKLLKIDEKGQLTTEEYNLSNIKEISLNSFQKTEAQSGAGSYGTFEMVLADGQSTKGEETFDLWQALVNLVSNIVNAVLNFIT